MSRIKKIVAAQVASAKVTGEINPYSLEARHQVVVKTRQKGATAQTIDHYIEAMKLDAKRLKEIKGLGKRNAVKKNLVKNYQAVINDANNGRLIDSELIGELLIWLFDVEDIEQALKLSYILVDKGQKLPSRFDRDIETFICDATYDWAAKLLKAEPVQSARPYIDQLIAVLENQTWDLNFIVHGKMYAMLAKHQFNAGDYKACIASCDKSKKINPEKHGTVKLRAQAEARKQAD